ncbi:DUF2797 domain-containing protein [bacterium (Candidatus Blackallbacteria) CG17_big_fil_post_rev_8_21_14_2_50_48_46]|uniref:DUF2797 domain-containing protein n=1 Tax=bacterium (Candidatus Blackallbacteria) CG17_big_fil_post_rev_8_21_14_2_50_48_46 TaxID=2014261 RepID=A0A2M7G5L3_9BACT|nr:MAG: hypothetical protein COW64_18410 [bacterium (Candidatus Blackallbacteria) CG18_big_fil_WC_8_21_14_2_50_49_26]PIW16864.1 MAG: DUF2797 domain-containing protein [bacterium (Candidatus Blackallbacteria) CG17_big_fil_post_rev_8_21_14_2_50_48_46]PIW48061.1 MAG: DUF2797 domain-containing protein [bacterium (Candidatus Blackallbacteria) CG13_big_fil_rev_8_21_14_2_50_49_14]
MPLIATGSISKMKAKLETPVHYHLPVGEQLVDMNALLGQQIRLVFTGKIFCQHCGRATSKSFSQGYCYPCMTTLAQCDSCIMSPEKCHFAQGTCREPEWGQSHCMIDHYVYLANASGIKVGITRTSQVPTRWIDQGAVQALPILRVSSRYLSGLAEVLFKTQVSDKTNWRKMLKNEVEALDLAQARDQLFNQLENEFKSFVQTQESDAVQFLEAAESVNIDYPVLEYPQKVSSFNLDKDPQVAGELRGIKGQYLIFSEGVINLRKYTGYQLEVYTE